MFNVGDRVKCTCGCVAQGFVVTLEEITSRPEWRGMGDAFHSRYVSVRWEDDHGFTSYEFVKPDKLTLLQARRKKIQRNLPAWF